jgi:hypothetical protein
MRGFSCDNSIHVYSAPWTSSPPFSNSVWWVPSCCLHMCICSALPSSAPLWPLAGQSPTCLSFIVLIIIVGLGSTTEILRLEFTDQSWLGRLTTTWAMTPPLFALVILEIGFFCPGQLDWDPPILCFLLLRGWQACPTTGWGGDS